MAQDKVYKTMKEAVADMFFRKVLGVAVPLKIKKTTKIEDFCPNKKFKKEYVELIIDNTDRVFNVSIRKIKDKSLAEILVYLEHRKMKHSTYGS
jgi:hypothetical protein